MSSLYDAEELMMFSEGISKILLSCLLCPAAITWLLTELAMQ